MFRWQTLLDIKISNTRCTSRTSGTSCIVSHFVVFSSFSSFQVIFVNLITIGLEAQTSLMNQEEFQPWSWPWVSERIFLLVYCHLAKDPSRSVLLTLAGIAVTHPLDMFSLVLHPPCLRLRYVFPFSRLGCAAIIVRLQVIQCSGLYRIIQY